MSKYRHSRLSSTTSIRLLRLLPSKQKSIPLQCELYQYPIQYSDATSSPYEALSYVWGSEDRAQAIFIDNQALGVTKNLHTALLRVRDHTCARTLWVDAVCINQEDDREKESQIQLMVEIYAKAARVLIWLGEAEEEADKALETIRLTGETPERASEALAFRDPVQKLLQRAWFRRVWVLQEMAAARHVAIMCGSMEISGHAFCSGLDSLNAVFPLITTRILPLIRGAIFRPRVLPRRQGRLSLDICSLAELVDMYHTHNATKLHDKVFALLNMCTDDFSRAGLAPDYTLPWNQLMQRLVNFLLGNQVYVTTFENQPAAFIAGKGWFLGKITKVETKSGLNGGQTISVYFKYPPQRLAKRRINATWSLPTSAKSIQKDDIVCLLQEASLPIIVKLCEQHLKVIIAAVVPPERFQTQYGSISSSEIIQPTPFSRDLMLFWDWRAATGEIQEPIGYENAMHKCILYSHIRPEAQSQLITATRDWHMALILGDMEEYQKAEDKLAAAVESYEIVTGCTSRDTTKCRFGLTPLCWAAGNGNSHLIAQLIDDNVELDLKDSEYGQSPLSWATENGHKEVIELLLKTGQVDIESRAYNGQTPLALAAKNGHYSIVDLLLQRQAVNADSKDENNCTPLLHATVQGHQKITELLLKSGKIAIESTNKGGETSLLLAAAKGHTAILKSLLDIGANVDTPDTLDRSPLWHAALFGHEIVVKLLLNAGASPDTPDVDRCTPLWIAASNGHRAIVQMLLIAGAEKDMQDAVRGSTPLWQAAGNGHDAVVQLLLNAGAHPGICNRQGRTALWQAAMKGHEAVVKTLLESDMVDVDTAGDKNQTSLHAACRNKEEAVARLLIETGELDINSSDDYGETALSTAAGSGSEAVVRYLLMDDNIDVNSKNKNNVTPLIQAVIGGHNTVVQLLLETGKADINICCKRGPISLPYESKKGYTSSQNEKDWLSLHFAAEKGHGSVIKTLLEAGSVDINATTRNGQTPLSLAAQNGQEATVSLILKVDRVDVNATDGRDRSPLWLAARGGHKNIVKMLLQVTEIETDFADQEDDTPLSQAALQGHETIVQLLLGTGKVNPNAQSADGKSPLFRAAKNGHETVIESLLATGTVDTNLQDEKGRTALWKAVMHGHEASVKLLLDKGKVDPDRKDKGKNTPLLAAVVKGYKAVVQLLLKTGKVDPNTVNYQQMTPLTEAIKKGHPDIVKLLLQTGKVDVNPQQEEYDGPLLTTIKEGSETMVKLLLETGKVDVNVRGRFSGHTAVSLASRDGHQNIVKLLLETGEVDAPSEDDHGASDIEDHYRDSYNRMAQGIVAMMD